MKPAILILLAFVLAGCAGVRGLVTAKVRIASGTNVVEITQPKDTTIERLRWNGLELDGYASSGNAAAIATARAQAEAQARVLTGSLDLAQDAVRTFGGMQGIRYPIRDMRNQPTPAPMYSPPPGMKLVPIDDPSEPQPEIAP